MSGKMMGIRKSSNRSPGIKKLATGAGHRKKSSIARACKAGTNNTPPPSASPRVKTPSKTFSTPENPVEEFLDMSPSSMTATVRSGLEKTYMSDAIPCCSKTPDFRPQSPTSTPICIDLTRGKRNAAYVKANFKAPSCPSKGKRKAVASPSKSLIAFKVPRKAALGSKNLSKVAVGTDDYPTIAVGSINPPTTAVGSNKLSRYPTIEPEKTTTFPASLTSKKKDTISQTVVCNKSGKGDKPKRKYTRRDAVKNVATVDSAENGADTSEANIMYARKLYHNFLRLRCAFPELPGVYVNNLLVQCGGMLAKTLDRLIVDQIKASENCRLMSPHRQQNINRMYLQWNANDKIYNLFCSLHSQKIASQHVANSRANSITNVPSAGLNQKPPPAHARTHNVQTNTPTSVHQQTAPVMFETIVHMGGSQTNVVERATSQNNNRKWQVAEQQHAPMQYSAMIPKRNVPPPQMMPQGVTPRGMGFPGMVSSGTVPQGMVPNGRVPDGLGPSGRVQSWIPSQMTPQVLESQRTLPLEMMHSWPPGEVRHSGFRHPGPGQEEIMMPQAMMSQEMGPQRVLPQTRLSQQPEGTFLAPTIAQQPQQPTSHFKIPQNVHGPISAATSLGQSPASRLWSLHQSTANVGQDIQKDLASEPERNTQFQQHQQMIQQQKNRRQVLLRLRKQQQEQHRSQYYMQQQFQEQQLRLQQQNNQQQQQKQLQKNLQLQKQRKQKQQQKLEIQQQQEQEKTNLLQLHVQQQHQFLQQQQQQIQQQQQMQKQHQMQQQQKQKQLHHRQQLLHQQLQQQQQQLQMQQQLWSTAATEDPVRSQYSYQVQEGASPMVPNITETSNKEMDPNIKQQLKDDYNIESDDVESATKDLDAEIARLGREAQQALRDDEIVLDGMYGSAETVDNLPWSSGDLPPNFAMPSNAPLNNALALLQGSLSHIPFSKNWPSVHDVEDVTPPSPKTD